MEEEVPPPKFLCDECTMMLWKHTVQKLAQKLGDHLSADSH